MQVFAAEREAGLADALARSVATVTAPFKVSNLDKSGLDAVVEQLKRMRKSEAVADRPDFARIVSILVSTTWNANGDVFLPEPTFAARHTPIDTPINFEHDSNTTIGHITASRVLLKDGTQFDGDEAPDDFDIEVEGVLYRALLGDVVEEIIESARAGEVAVSMECWFDSFDYAMRHPDSPGDIRVVSRTEDTAHLTKHLAAFGGDGKLNGLEIGRVLRNIRFAAQGIVRNPANPDSVIKQVARIAACRNCTLDEIDKEDDDMSVELELEKARETLAAVTAERDSVRAELRTLRDRDFEGRCEALGESLTEAGEAKKELEAKVGEAAKRADEAEAKLSDIERTEAARDRLAKLREVRKVEDEDATLAELRDMSDETFEAVLKYAGSKAEQANDADKAAEEAATKANRIEKAEAENDAEAVLSTVESDDPDFQTGDSDDNDENDGWTSLAERLVRTTNDKEEAKC